MNDQDIPVFPADMMKLLGIKHPNTLRIRIKSGQIPEPDVKITQKTKYWFRSSLVKAGLLEEANSPTPVT